MKQLMVLGLLGVSALLTLSLSSPAQARVYKCIDASGGTTYSQTPCPVQDQTADVLASVQSKAKSLDCRIAQNFTRRTAGDMKNGATADQVFNQYGGIDALSGTSIALINYIFSHRQNVDTSAARITALTVSRCQVGSFGPVGCNHFPYEFIGKLGGCEAAASPQFGRQRQARADSGDFTQPPQSNAISLQQQALLEQANNATSSEQQSAALMALRNSQCRMRVEDEMDSVLDQMRIGQSAAGQNSLREKRRNLRKQLGQC